MVDPLSTASAVAGLVSVAVQLFDGCVKGFVLLSAAQSLGSRATILNCQLEWQHYNLYWWATTAGLFKQPPELNASNPQLVEKTLRCLEQLLTDVHKLRETYRLDIAVTYDELNSLDVRGSYFGSQNFRGQPFMKDIARVYQKRASPWRKLKWAALDRDNFSYLIRDIQYFNEQLRDSLHHSDRSLCSDHAIEGLEALVSTTTNRVILELVTDELQCADELVKASASVRRQKLILDAREATGGEHAPTSLKRVSTIEPKSLNLSLASLVPAPGCDLSLLKAIVSEKMQSQSALHKAIYCGDDVFVEWKDVPTTRDRQLRHRVANVASLLASMEHTSFRSLRCIGYVKDSKAQRYGYIFQPPTPDARDTRSLAMMLANERWRPNLTTRIGIAAELTGALRQLHNAGWLHKSMQSDNIQFFGPSWSENPATWMLSQFYICGYGFARIDTPTEMTEDPAMAQLLYRHPLAVDADRVPFCKAFDLYSLGCILLEISLCRPLVSILAAYDTRKRQEDMTVLKDEQPNIGIVSATISSQPFGVVSRSFALMDDLHDDNNDLVRDVRFAVGDCYLNIIRTCLRLSSSIDDEDHEKSVFEAEIKIWKQLKELHRTHQ